MKFLTIIASFLISTLLSAQTDVQFNESDVKETLLSGFPTKYADIHPESFAGNYTQRSDNSRNTTEAVIVLNSDGTCSTEWYNSGYVGKPKRSTTTGTWGLILDNDKKIVTDDFDGAIWYKIVLISDSEEDLEYYDKKAWYDWVAVYPNGDVYLKLVYSTGEKIKKK